MKSKEVTSAVFSETCLARMSRVSEVCVCMYIFPNSFSYGVFANLGFGAVPGRLPNHGFPGRFRGGSGTESGAGSGQCFKEVRAGSRALFPERGS